MARGWESKGIEAQQEEAATRHSSAKPRLSPELARRHREIENLRLSLRNVIGQLSVTAGSPRRSALEQAKDELEQKIAILTKQD